MTEAEEGPKILCDPAWISQAVDNLLSNAIKYSHSGTFVRVCLTFSPAAVRLDVTDQGQGIPEKELSKLFGYFQRLSPRPTGGEKSTGLGLSIVKAVCKCPPRQGYR